MGTLEIISIIAVLITAIAHGAARRVAQHKTTLLIREETLPDWWPAKWLSVGYVLRNILLFVMIAVCLYALYELFVVSSNPGSCIVLVVILVIVWVVGLLVGIGLSSKVLRAYAKRYDKNLPPECFGLYVYLTDKSLSFTLRTFLNLD